ncbi:MAG: PD40 domain-containing protein [Anaerolineales bacterium]|nr:PD40 domain-containing protein [Anaerolineales bacterium]
MSVKKIVSLFFILLGLMGCSSLVINKPQTESLASSTITPTQQIPTATPAVDLLLPTPAQTLQITTTLKETGIGAIHFGETIVPLENPSWSHNGTMVAFSQGNKDISIVNTSTWQDIQTVCEVQHYTDLVWSPDDSKIAFNANPLCLEGENCISKIVIQQCDMETGEISPLPNLPEGISNVLDWYGNTILLRNDSFVIYNTETQDTATLDLPFMDKDMYRTAYFVDESHILYMGNEVEPDVYNGTGGVDPAIYIANIETLEVQKMVDAGTVNINNPSYSASISPNGRWIAWLWIEKVANERVRKFNIFDVETGLSTTLLQNNNVPWSLPSWSPDSQDLVFIEDKGIKVLKINTP